MQHSLSMKSVITPVSTFKLIKIVSTIVDEWRNETAVAEIDALNSSNALMIANADEFKTIKTHKTEQEAIDYHTNYLKSKK